MSESPAESTEPSADAPPRRGRVFLRVLGVIVILLGAAGIAYQQGVIRVPQAVTDVFKDPAVAELERLGGVIKFQDNPGGKRESSAYLGNQWVGGDDNLALLTKLPNLTTLYIENQHISDKGLSHIGKLADLEFLLLTAPRVTDEGMAHLAGLPRLRQLYLSQVELTDAGMESVVQLENIARLHLTATKVTDQSVEHLKAMKHLSAVDVSGTEFTDAGVAALRDSRPDLEVQFADDDVSRVVVP